MIRFTARFYPHWRSDLEQEYLRKFELPALANHQASVARHAREARAAPRVVQRRGAPDLGRAHLRSRSRGDGRGAAGARRARRAARDDGAVLVASARRRRSDRRSHRDHRPRPHASSTGRSRTCATTTVAFSSCSTARRRTRTCARRESCPRGVKGACCPCSLARARNAIVDEARSLKPVSVDVLPVTLKEIFLETVASED